jgi:hypothetical protein
MATCTSRDPATAPPRQADGCVGVGQRASAPIELTDNEVMHAEGMAPGDSAISSSTVRNASNKYRGPLRVEVNDGPVRIARLAPHTSHRYTLDVTLPDSPGGLDNAYQGSGTSLEFKWSFAP